MYTVAVASNTCSNEDEAVIQIPVSVQCSEEVHRSYTTVPQLVEEQLTLPPQHYRDVQTQQYTQVREALYKFPRF